VPNPDIAGGACSFISLVPDGKETASAQVKRLFLGTAIFRKRVRAAVVSSCPQRYEYLTDWKTLHTFVWLTIVLAKAEGDQMTPPAKVAAVTAAARFGH
jgi:hypothetical protein